MHDRPGVNDAPASPVSLAANRRAIGVSLAAIVVLLAGHASLGAEPVSSGSKQPTSLQRGMIISVPESSAQASIWTAPSPDGRDVSMYSFSLDGVTFTEPRVNDQRLLMRVGAFDPLNEPAPVADAFKSKLASDVVIVQFHTPALDAYRADIQRLGGAIWKYLPNNAYVVRLPEAGRKTLAEREYVRWIGAFEPGFKLDPATMRSIADSPLEGAGKQSWHVMVFERGVNQKDVVAKRAREIGADVSAADVGGRLMVVEATLAQVSELAQLDEVMYIDLKGESSFDGEGNGEIGNDMSIVREVVGANYIRDTLGLTGQGVRGELVDDNIRDTHVDFQANPIIFHTARAGPTDHGTNMYGTIFGTGTGDPLGTGMMPAAQGIFADQNIVETNRYTLTQDLMSSPYFAVFQSNSWGGTQTPFYTTRSALMDDILFDFNIVITNSMSNLGNQNARPEAWAKNIISVGAILHRNTSTVADDCWCGLGSIGPASDGRLKPDVANYGDFVYSPWDTSDTAYGQGCCTSIATAITSGTVGLFHQTWHAGLYNNTPGATVFDSRPKNTFTKAMLINTASQWTFSGVGQDLGRTRQGWGQPSLRNAVDTSKVLLINETEVLAPLASRTWNVTVNPGDGFLKATMVYSDPAATPGAFIHRVNNLSLRLTAPDSSIYWGNSALTTGNWSASGGSEDNLNTVENVFVENPAAGTWQVTVIASEINEDGHVETGPLDADFSLVVTKPAQQEPAPGFDMSWFTIDGGGATFMNGGDFEMSSTTGQPDAGRQTSAEFAIDSGFWGAERGPGCAGDANGDGQTNGADLSVLLSQFGTAVSPGTGADFNDDGSVNGADLSVLLANFGCPN